MSEVNLNEIEGPVYAQHPDEGEKAYRTFDEWLKLGPDRTVVQAYKNSYNGKLSEEEKEELNRAPTYIYEWKSKYKWDERAEEYDAEVYGDRRKEYEAEIREMADRYAELSEVLSKVQRAAIRRWEDMDEAEIAAEFKDKDIESYARTLTMLQKIEDKARGRPLETGESPSDDFLSMLKEVDQD